MGGPDQHRDRARGRHRDLEDEDRAPVEGLGERAADRRAQRGGEHRRPEPQATPGARASEEVEDRRQPRAGADGLRAARDEQAGEVVGARAPALATAKSAKPPAPIARADSDEAARSKGISVTASTMV